MRAKVSTTDSPDTMAGVLAMIMASSSESEPSEIRMLEDLDGFASIGVSKAQFLRVYDRFRRGPCQALFEHGQLTLGAAEMLDDLLRDVHDGKNRVLLCRLAACMLVADGHVEEIEREVYERMLFRWGYTQLSVAQAILAEGMPRKGALRAELI
jgi:hypothetical protein